MSEPGSISPKTVPDTIRPLVAGAVSGKAVWIFSGVMLVAAVGLFSALESGRADRQLDALSPQKVADAGMIAPPPPLTIPEPPTAVQQPWPLQPENPLPVARPVQLVRTVASPVPVGRSRPPSQPPTPYQAQTLPPLAVPAGPAVVYQAPVGLAPAAAPSEAGQKSDQRAEATRLANPSTTVPQGAVVQAVLETALDSTRPGPARAIVSRDVRSFDGTRILIPRGSRLYGDYKADLALGQNRATIQWTRLTRPDGVVIALDSPSADPLGRAGIGGKVNTHFWSRFGGALLQTSLNLGSSLLTRDVLGGTVILGLPGSTQTVAPQGETVRPTLKVAQGTPVSVFVSRDLDFTKVEP